MADGLPAAQAELEEAIHDSLERGPEVPNGVFEFFGITTVIQGKQFDLRWGEQSASICIGDLLEDGSHNVTVSVVPPVGGYSVTGINLKNEEPPKVVLLSRPRDMGLVDKQTPEICSRAAALFDAFTDLAALIIQTVGTQQQE